MEIGGTGAFPHRNPWRGGIHGGRVWVHGAGARLLAAAWSLLLAPGGCGSVEVMSRGKGNCCSRKRSWTSTGHVGMLGVDKWKLAGEHHP